MSSDKLPFTYTRLLHVSPIEKGDGLEGQNMGDSVSSLKSGTSILT